VNSWKALPLLAMLVFCVGCQPIIVSQSSSSIPSTGTAGSSEEVNTDETLSPEEGAYKELLIHANMILGPRRNYENVPIPPQIIVGDIPQNLPFPLQFPTEVRIIGSISTPDQTEGSIYATTPQSLAEVWEFLRAEFEQRGYESLSELEPIYQAMDFASFFYLVCGPDPDIEVMVTLYELTPGATNIQIHVAHIPGGNPCWAKTVAAMNSDADFPLPQLLAPPGVVSRDALGGNVQDAYAYDLSEVGGTLSTSQLFAHYSQQLVEKGWQQIDGEGLTSPSLSQWMFEDALNYQWDGQLYILPSDRVPSDSSLSKHLILIRAIRKPK
jgi:hypothetical protein